MVRRSTRTAILAGMAAILGVGLAAFYVLPATCEQRWANIAQVLAPGVRPQDNFLFTTITDPEHTIFNLLVSAVASAEIVLLALAVLGVKKLRSEQPNAWKALLAWASAAALAMFSFSALLWNYLPLLRYLQLPWRLLLCLNVVFALIMACSGGWVRRMMTCIAMFAVLVLGWQYLQAPWWDSAEEIGKLASQHQNGAGYEGAEEYVPAGADAYDVNRSAPLVGMDGTGAARVHVQRWSPELRSFVAESQQAGRVMVRLFNYPAWEVTVNGRPVEAESQEDTGQMAIPVQAGENHIQVRFVHTWDRVWGAVISLLMAAFVAMVWAARWGWQ